MKAFLAAVAFFYLVFPVWAAEQSPNTVIGCVLYKPASAAWASVVEYRSYRDFGTNITVIDQAGVEVRIFGGQEPIFIPYPSDPSADPQAVNALIKQARERYPERKQRLAVIEKAWAAVPRKSVVPVAPAPVPQVQAAQEKTGMEIVTTTGKKFENITISRVEPDGLMVMTDAGVEKIPFVTLPSEIQKKYGYNPEAAAAFTAALAVAQKENAMRAQQVREVEQRKVMEQAKVEEARRVAAAEGAEKARQSLEIKETSVLKVIKVTQVMDNGVLARLGTAVEMIQNKTAGEDSGPKYKRRGDWQDELVFIYLRNTKELLDGSEVVSRLFPVGRLQYTSVLGAKQTVASYAATPETALEIIRSRSGKDSEK